jgi:hypothetical protein
LGIGTQFVGADLTEGEHVVDAPVARTIEPPLAPSVNGDGAAAPEAARLTKDQAREPKRLAQTAYGFAAGEAQLRGDLGLEEGKPLTLMRLQAHVTAAQYAALREAYEAHLQQAVEADVP